MAFLRLNSVARRRRQRNPNGVFQEVPLFEGLNAEFRAGEITFLTGPSGCGKSSLLRLLNRLEDPQSGVIHFRDRPLTEYPVLELRRRLVLVRQQPTPFPGTVLDNLLHVPLLLGHPRRESEARATALLGEMALPTELLPRSAGELSVGQLQRVCVARALMLEPEALLLDEPTSSLDVASAEALRTAMQRRRDENGLSAVWVTHQTTEPAAVGGPVWLLEGGALTPVVPAVATGALT